MTTPRIIRYEARAARPNPSDQYMCARPQLISRWCSRTDQTARERRLCRPGDCADLGAASVAQQEPRTGDVGTILCEWCDATVRLVQIARANSPSCFPERLVVGRG
jgi:hypothetical protein